LTKPTRWSHGLFACSWQKHLRHPNVAKLFVHFVLSEGQRFLAGLGGTVVRPGIKNKYPQLVAGVKLYLVKPDIGKNYEDMSKTYYDIVNARYWTFPL
jgi:ABC-type Fe3+ transport system substrate-binding protein